MLCLACCVQSMCCQLKDLCVKWLQRNNAEEDSGDQTAGGTGFDCRANTPSVKKQQAIEALMPDSAMISRSNCAYFC